MGKFLYITVGVYFSLEQGRKREKRDDIKYSEDRHWYIEVFSGTEYSEVKKGHCINVGFF